MILKAIEKAGYKPGEDVFIALDPAASELYDAETALDICAERAGDQLLARTLMPRLDPDLRSLLDQGTRFNACPAQEPAAAEYPEEAPCSWDA